MEWPDLHFWGNLLQTGSMATETYDPERKPSGQILNFRSPDTDLRQSQMVCIIFQVINLLVQFTDNFGQLTN